MTGFRRHRQSKSREFVKIGYATDITTRLLVTATVYDPCQFEDVLHARFEDCRVRGEWFKIPKHYLAALLAELKARSQ